MSYIFRSEGRSTEVSGAEGAMSPETANPSLFAKYRNRLLLGLGAALILRFVLMALPLAFWTDLNTFKAWSIGLVQHGIGDFYKAPDMWCDYPPGYLYVLWWLGKIQQLVDPGLTHTGGMGFTWLMKLPAALADIGCAWLIWTLLKTRTSVRSAYYAGLAYAFNPLAIFVSAIWGQIDGVLTLAMLAVTYLLMQGNLLQAAGLAVAGVMLKPQGLFLAPFFMLSQWFRFRPARWALTLPVGLGVVWALVAPFYFPHQEGLSLGSSLVGPFQFLYERMTQTAAGYPHSSVNAFNIWAPTGMWLPDSRTILGLSHKTLGLGFVAILCGWMGLYLYRKRHAGSAPIFLAAAVLLVGMFLLPTRMHERYIFPAIAFLALASGFNRYLKTAYWAFTVTALLNVLYAFILYNHKPLYDAIAPGVMQALIIGIVLVNMWFFGDLIGYTFGRRSETMQQPTLSWRRVLFGPPAPETPDEAPALPEAATASVETVETPAIAASAPEGAAPIPAAPTWSRADWAWLIGIAVVFLAIGLYRLGYPPEQIFDEVYHARTAEEYLKGINPYEWTHPPLAKLLAALGIAAFGMDGFGWRIVSLLAGTGTLAVFYLFSRRVFGSMRIAAIATTLLALDGVFFVQSRVAMTNIYVVGFLIVAALGLWEFSRTTKERWLVLSGIGLGCALATRWTALYGWGLIGLLLLHHLFWHMWKPLSAARMTPMQVAGFLARCAAYFVAIPAAIYLLSYIPYMLQGHHLGEVLTLQKSMWGYHANLNATHNYSSAWYQWPFMYRPTWYFYQAVGEGKIAGILAIGNPAVWWLSIPALLTMGVLAVRRKLWAGLFLSTMGLGLYLLWAVQPRSLVFMHYMFETIPFACLAIAYFIDRLWRHRDFQVLAFAYLATAVGMFIFWYPLWSGLPIPQAFYRMHLWLPTWI
ncbi:putative dolichyl-phosphate-mannose--protein mannosyltransferase [compost metagenome]